MDVRPANITVSALVGTGAATLGLALFGLAGLGSQLRAADAARPTTPVVTQQLSDTLDQERSSPKWDGHSALPERRDAAPDSGRHTAPSPSPSSVPHREL
ncbi:MAG: hypothetical protein QM679_11325 [Patulibacter sp.]